MLNYIFVLFTLNRFFIVLCRTDIISKESSVFDYAKLNRYVLKYFILSHPNAIVLYMREINLKSMKDFNCGKLILGINAAFDPILTLYV